MRASSFLVVDAPMRGAGRRNVGSEAARRRGCAAAPASDTPRHSPPAPRHNWPVAPARRAAPAPSPRDIHLPLRHISPRNALGLNPIHPLPPLTPIQPRTRPLLHQTLPVLTQPVGGALLVFLSGRRVISR